MIKHLCIVLPQDKQHYRILTFFPSRVLAANMVAIIVKPVLDIECSWGINGLLVTSCSLCSPSQCNVMGRKSSGLSKEAVIYSDAHPRETILQHQKYSHIKRLKTNAFIYFKFDLNVLRNTRLLQKVRNSV